MSSRLIRVGALVLGPVAVALAIWLASGVIEVGRAVARLQSEGSQIATSLSLSDLDGAASTIDSLEVCVNQLNEATERPAWQLVERLPLVGDTARSVSGLGRALGDYLQTLQPLAAHFSGTQPVLVGLSQMADDQSGLVAAVGSGELLTDALAELTGRELVRPVVAPLRTLSRQLGRMHDVFIEAAKSASEIGGILGNDSTRRWLVLIQTPSGAQSGEPVPVVYSVLTVDHGHVGLSGYGTLSLADTAVADDRLARSRLEEVEDIVGQRFDLVIDMDYNVAELMLQGVSSPGESSGALPQGSPADRDATFMKDRARATGVLLAGDFSSTRAFPQELIDLARSRSVTIWAPRPSEQVWLMRMLIERDGGR